MGGGSVDGDDLTVVGGTHVEPRGRADAAGDEPDAAVAEAGVDPARVSAARVEHRAAGAAAGEVLGRQVVAVAGRVDLVRGGGVRRREGAEPGRITPPDE